MRPALLFCICCLLFPAFPGRAQDSLDIAVVKQGGKWLAIDRQGRRLTPPDADVLDDNLEGYIGNGLIPFQKNDRYGFCSLIGENSFPAVYEQVYGFRNGLAAVRLNGLWGYINRQGKLRIPAVYDAGGAFDASGKALVSRNGRLSVIDTTARVLRSLPYQPYGMGFSINAPLHAVRSGEKIGFIDNGGELVIDTAYDFWYDRFSYGMTFLSRNDSVFAADASGRVRFVTRVNKKGRTIYEAAANDIVLQVEQLFDQSEMTCRYLSLDGKDVFNKIFREADDFIDGYAMVTTTAGDVTCIDRQGREVFRNSKGVLISPLNTSASFATGLVLAFQVMNSKTCSCQKLTEYYGYLDRNGDWMIEPAYEKADVFSLGLAAVAQDTLFGYIDAKGGWVIQPQYDDARPFIRVALK